MTGADEVNKAAVSNFSTVCLQLCEVSYLPIGGIQNAVLKDVYPFSPRGQWQCNWVAQSSDQANLALVALYYPPATSTPEWAAVTIRGTNINEHVDIWGILKQIYEDCEPVTQVPLPWLPVVNQSRVAKGSMDGLNTILTITPPRPGAQSLEPYLATLLHDYPALKIAVVGHSLGGCLTTLLAPLLRHRFNLPPGQVVPITFAAPTAGNQPFANYFNGEFSTTVCYASSLDCAPLAWWNLASIASIYQQCPPPPGLSAPSYVYAALLTILSLFYEYGASYAPVDTIPLQASCKGNQDWLCEAWYQHHPSTYMQALGGTDIPSMPKLDICSSPARSTLQAQLGPLSEVVSKMKSGAS